MLTIKLQTVSFMYNESFFERLKNAIVMGSVIPNILHRKSETESTIASQLTSSPLYQYKAQCLVSLRYQGEPLLKIP